MSTTERIVMAVLLVTVDLVVFIIPVTGLLGAYIMIARPQWFRDWISKLYGEPG